MTSLQKTVAAVTLIVAIGIAIYEARRASQLAEEIETLRAKNISTGDSGHRTQPDGMARQLISQEEEAARLKEKGELLKLRGEVARLKASIPPSPETPPEKEPEGIREWVEVVRRANSEFTIAGKLLVLKGRLRLTSDQESSMKSLLEQMYDPAKRRESYAEVKKHLDSDPAAFLTPEQRASFAELEKEDRLREAERSGRQNTDAGLEQLETTLGITPEQRDKVYPALLELELRANPSGLESKEEEQQSSAREREVGVQRLNIWKGILTDEQFAIFKKYQEEIWKGDELLEAVEKNEAHAKEGSGR